METATLFALAVRRGLEAGSLLLVSDLLLGGRTRIDAEALRDGEQRLGERGGERAERLTYAPSG